MKTTKEILQDSLKPLNIEVMTFDEHVESDDGDDMMEDCTNCGADVPADTLLCDDCQAIEDDEEIKEIQFEIDQQVGRR